MKAGVWIAAAALLLGPPMRGAEEPAGCAEPQLDTQPAERQAKEPGEALTLVSVNLAKETDDARIAADLRKAGLLERLDVLSLQEVRRDSGVAVRLAQRLGMSAAVAGIGSGAGGDQTDGVALLSRYPLRDAEAIPLPRNELGVRTRCRVALAATVAGVRAIGLHLDTRVNAQRRLEQVRPILEAAAGFDGPVALAGDFNTNGFWWIEHLIPVPFVNDQAQALYDRLTAAGYRSPFSPGGQATNDFLGLQLDWVFLRGLEAGNSGVEPLGFTDHHAVWVRAALR